MSLMFPLTGAAEDLWFETSQYTTAVTTLLSCSRASIGYAKTSTGTLTQFANNAVRITDLGLLVEDARTNVILWNRDLTNVLWIAVNITAAKDQIGPDGVSNSASSITATAGNGTILQTTVIASSARYQSAWVKRITGTGTVNMTMDNGSTWTAVTVTSSWTLVEIPTQTMANPIVGFRIVTSGDAIAVDFVQNEDGTFASSPIPTTTAAATRAADVVNSIGNLTTAFSNTAVSTVIDIKVDNLNASPTDSWFLDNATGKIFLFCYLASYTTLWASNNISGDLQQANGAADIFIGTKLGLAYDGSGRSLAGKGLSPASDAITMVGGTIFLGGSSSHHPFAYFRRLTAWTSRLADATLQALTDPNSIYYQEITTLRAQIWM